MSNRPAKNADPWVSVILIAQLSIIAGQEARTQGATWDDLLHWAGELLLISGIVLAAWGISDVRREWTQLPGFWGASSGRRGLCEPTLPPPFGAPGIGSRDRCTYASTASLRIRAR